MHAYIKQLTTGSTSDTVESERDKAGVCWSVQKGGIKVLRVQKGDVSLHNSQTNLHASGTPRGETPRYVCMYVFTCMSKNMHGYGQ